MDRFVRRTNALVAAHVKVRGLTLEQWQILDCIVRNEKIPMTDLASAVFMPAASVTRAVDKLVANALVYRQAAMNDRRRVLVRASRRGEDLRDDLVDELAHFYGSAYEVLGEAERSQLIKLARQL
ncbi:MarR family winged helix-turn-helix transcriptional regulator [Aeromicrobium yanjiei]|nr:MarR family transcriptional regulator [Aeromicrobium yanjiei]